MVGGVEGGDSLLVRLALIPHRRNLGLWLVHVRVAHVANLAILYKAHVTKTHNCAGFLAVTSY
jgi:hypothetical protein